MHHTFIYIIYLRQGIEDMRMRRVLEVNVDDNGYGGVYAFVLNILENIDQRFQIDLCAFENFEKKEHIKYVEKLGDYLYE